MSAKITHTGVPDLDSLPVICEEIQLPAAIPTDLVSDGRFGVSAYGGINSRELALCDGRWYVRWPGFSWRAADANYM